MERFEESVDATPTCHKRARSSLLTQPPLHLPTVRKEREQVTKENAIIIMNQSQESRFSIIAYSTAVYTTKRASVFGERATDAEIQLGMGVTLHR